MISLNTAQFNDLFGSRADLDGTRLETSFRGSNSATLSAENSPHSVQELVRN